MIDVLLLGTGAMTPLPRRGLSSILLRHEGQQILIDCGEGTQTAIRRFGWGLKSIGGIALTHFHGDHLFGLPGLLQSMMHAGREEPVWISGPEGIGTILRLVRILTGELTFPIQLVEQPEFAGCGLKIRSFPLRHRVPALGYRFERERAGEFRREKALELGIPVEFWSVLQKGESAAGWTPQSVLGPPRKSLVVTVAQDSAPCGEIVETGKEADLMILEATYAGEEKKEAAGVYGHMTFAQAAELAARAGAKELWLTHFSPSLAEPKDFLPLAQAAFPRTRIGEDGMRATLRFDKAGERKQNEQ